MDKLSIKSETGCKSSDSKDNKHESINKKGEKRPADPNTRKFAVLSSEYINVVAESIGISDLPVDVQAGLAEDASYKLREIIHNCNVMLKNTKRRKLSTDDVNRVFQVFNVPTIYGHLSADREVEFIPVPNSDVFVEKEIEENIVEMAFSDMEVTQMKDQYVKGMWQIVEPTDQSNESKDGKQKEAISNAKPGTSSENSAGKSTPQKSGEKPEDPPGASRPPSHLLNYYLQVAKVIISGSTALLEVALNDLRTNSNVSPVCPYFLNLVALSVNKLQRHGWLTDALLSTVKALVENQYVDPSCYLAANRAANSLLVIAIEPKIAKNCDDLLLRSRAAELLSKVLHIWTIEMKQQMDIVRQLLQLLLDKNISLQSQYGAIVCLISLGYRILFLYFWPVMERYFPLLEEKYKTGSSYDIAHVKGAIMIAAEMMYRKDWNSCTVEESKRRLRMDFMLSEYFGDSLIPRRQQYSNPLINHSKVNTNIKNSSAVYDFDFDYQNWNPSYMIQRRPFMQNTNMYVMKNTKEPINISEVFDVSNKLGKLIVFNFEGSNQIDYRELKRRKLDSKQVHHQSSVHRLSNLWYKQNIYKNSRTIKYCQLYPKCCSGDLYVLL